jgi:hypothetical protein
MDTLLAVKQIALRADSPYSVTPEEGKPRMRLAPARDFDGA